MNEKHEQYTLISTVTWILPLMEVLIFQDHYHALTLDYSHYPMYLISNDQIIPHYHRFHSHFLLLLVYAMVLFEDRICHYHRLLQKYIVHNIKHITIIKSASHTNTQTNKKKNTTIIQSYPEMDQILVDFLQLHSILQ